jgi:hypothetical protein
MTTTELLDVYQRLLTHEGPEGDAAYNLLMSHVEDAEFIRRAEEARLRYIHHREVCRLLLIFSPIYVCLAAGFLLMIVFG